MMSTTEKYQLPPQAFAARWLRKSFALATSASHVLSCSGVRNFSSFCLPASRFLAIYLVTSSFERFGFCFLYSCSCSYFSVRKLLSWSFWLSDKFSSVPSRFNSAAMLLTSSGVMLLHFLAGFLQIANLLKRRGGESRIFLRSPGFVRPTNPRSLTRGKKPAWIEGE